MAETTNQMAAILVTEKMLEAWTGLADANASHIRLGEINWVMIVRSLIAEVHRLKNLR